MGPGVLLRHEEAGMWGLGGSWVGGMELAGMQPTSNLLFSFCTLMPGGILSPSL